MKQKIFKLSTAFVAMFFMINVAYAAEASIDCGRSIIGIPVGTAKIIRAAYLIIKIGTPIALIFYGMFDFAKAVLGSSEDDIKKKQNKFIKRVIAAVILFLVLAIVEFIFAQLARVGVGNTTSCIDTILNGKF